MRKPTILFLILLLVMTALPGAPVLAQDGDDAAAISDELQEAGVLSATEWESPQYGAKATWGGDWVVGETTYTDPDNFKDGLALYTDTAYLGVTVIESFDETPEQYRERLVEFREDENPDEPFVILDSGEDGDLAYLLTTGETDGETFANVIEVDYLDEDADLLILVEVSAWIDEAEDVFAMAQEDVVIEGGAPFRAYTAERVAEVLAEPAPGGGEEPAGGDAPAASAPEPEAEPEEDLARGDEATELTGLLEPGLYQSPQFGATATWDSSWSVTSDAPTSDTGARMDNLKLQDAEGNRFQITTFISGNEAPEAYLERLIDERAAIDDAGELTIIDQGTVGDRAYVIYVTTVGGTDWYVLSEVALYNPDRDVLLKNEMLVRPENAQTVFDAIQASITVDGSAPFLYAEPLPEG